MKKVSKPDHKGPWTKEVAYCRSCHSLLAGSASVCWAAGRNTLSIAALGLKPRWGYAPVCQSCCCCGHYCPRQAACTLLPLLSGLHPSLRPVVSYPVLPALFLPCLDVSQCWGGRGGVPARTLVSDKVGKSGKCWLILPRSLSGPAGHCFAAEMPHLIQVWLSVKRKHLLGNCIAYYFK